jgi:hypothetical protein
VTTTYYELYDLHTSDLLVQALTKSGMRGNFTNRLNRRPDWWRRVNRTMQRDRALSSPQGLIVCTTETVHMFRTVNNIPRTILCMMKRTIQRFQRSPILHLRQKPKIQACSTNRQCTPCHGARLGKWMILDNGQCIPNHWKPYPLKKSTPGQILQ